jgi:UDP-glucose 4-epimerase
MSVLVAQKTTVAPVAVTGAGGYIGSRLVTALSAGQYEIAAFTRGRPVLESGGGLCGDLAGARVLFHLATRAHPGSAERHPGILAADRDDFRNLLDRLAKLERPPLVVLASSGGYVYDSRSPLPYNEDSPVRPATAYGRAKLRLERDLADHSGQIPGIALRLSGVYGPGQPTGGGQGVIAHWLEAARTGAALRLFGDPATVLDFIHVDDVVNALCRIALLAEAGACLPPVLNIGSGEATSLDRLLRMFMAFLVGAVRVERVPGRGFDRTGTVLDVRRAAAVLGWAPAIDLATGLVAVARAALGS